MSADFTPWSALAGGSLIGLAAALLLLVNGRTAGVSGILAGVVSPIRGDTAWRWLFLFGLGFVGLLALRFDPSAIGPSPRSLGALAAAGLLVGVGTRLSRGCTSGHGVCGVARGSVRSFVATGTFLMTGIVTVAALRLLGVAP